MSKRVTYCERWNGTLHKPIGVMSMDEARQRNDAGELYSVALGDPTHPDAFIEINWTLNYLGVWFFDEKCRRVLKYVFERVNDDQMFMTELGTWEYPPEAGSGLNEASFIETVLYSQDGTVRHREKDKRASEVRTKDIRDVPVDINWETVPEFGQWDSVARHDREPPAVTEHDTS